MRTARKSLGCWLLCGLLITTAAPLQGQAIQFSLFVSSALDATKQQDLNFDEIFSGAGNVQINLGDAGMGVFSITGNKEMDIIVTLSAPAVLTNTGPSTDTIPFTLEFAYANQGADDIFDAIVGTGGTARFPILRRAGGSPPGPPPTPENAGYTPADATAYIYIYGSMTVGNVDAGVYSGTVTLTVEYD